MVKEDAPELLRKELSSPKWKPQLVALSGNTDCYQPIEKQKQLTRRCLEVLLEFRNPAVIITKNHLVTRDIDILSELAKIDCIGVTISLTTLDRQTRIGAGTARALLRRAVWRRFENWPTPACRLAICKRR